MKRRKHRRIGDRSRFDEMMGPSSFEEMWFAAKGDDPDAFRGRISMLVPLGRTRQPVPVTPRDLRLIRGVLIGKVLGARTPEACDRADALIDEWTAAFPGDEEVALYGEFTARMRSALRHIEEDR